MSDAGLSATASQAAADGPAGGARLPDFLVIGAQKSGSTWLVDQLTRHPDVFMAPREIHFFDQAAKFAEGLDWYARHFAKAKPGQLIGEKTPDYLLYEKADGSRRPAPVRIHELLPEVRLLVILRNPAERAFSALRHHIWFGRLPAGEDPCALIFGPWADKAEQWNVLSNGLYGLQLGHIFRLFGRERVRVWIFEDDVRARPRETLREAAEFIGAATDWTPAEAGRAANRGLTRRAAFKANQRLPALGPLWQLLDPFLGERYLLDDACRARLMNYYADDIDRLENLLGRDLSVWRG